MSADRDLLPEVRALIERIAGPGRTPPDAGPDTPLADGFWLDSIELLEVLVACESRFGILLDSTSDLQSGAFNTLGTLTALIRSKLAARRDDS